MENISHYNVERAFQKRQILAIYAFFGYFVAYSMRTILSVAIIDMSGKKFEFNKSDNLTNRTAKVSLLLFVRLVFFTVMLFILEFIY